MHLHACYFAPAPLPTLKTKRLAFIEKKSVEATPNF